MLDDLKRSGMISHFAQNINKKDFGIALLLSKAKTQWSCFRLHVLLHLSRQFITFIKNWAED